MPHLYDNKYEYIEDLGFGGFGKVFLAKEKVSQRLVAIKQLKNTDPNQQDDIIHEIQTVAKFGHPHIVTFYHHFLQDGQLFLVMEYCHGGSLRKKMNETIPDSTIFNWFQLLAESFWEVHKKGIVHHDIKPDNILFTDAGTIKISDFGVANSLIGTTRYMSPEILYGDRGSVTDPRVDVYALGVTLMEVLIGENPFSYLSYEQILAMHEKGEFPIRHLPQWQQEIILKAIHKTPELRFQNMQEFSEAIQSKTVPAVFRREHLDAAKLIGFAERALKGKKWRQALKYLELARKRYPEDVLMYTTFGKYYLRMQKMQLAKSNLDIALRMNPRLQLHKELGWIHLEMKNYPQAISLLTDHLHRNPSDNECYNLLIRCYYETDRYEHASDLALLLMESVPQLSCFANNYYISEVMRQPHVRLLLHCAEDYPDDPFILYNHHVVSEDLPSHGGLKHPLLKSKLLFMDADFNKIKPNVITLLECSHKDIELRSYDHPIIKIGRTGYTENDILIPGGGRISRRHCVIINSLNNSWVYDLGSTTGTYLNDEKIVGKARLIGRNRLRIGDVEITLTTDRTKLL